MNIETRVMLLRLAAVFIAGCGAYTDLRDHKIYNSLTVTAVFIGILCNMVIGGWRGLVGSLLGILAGLTVTTLWILGMLKAGDVKLYIAVGAMGGWQFCGYTMIFSVLIGSLAAAIFMIVRRSGWTALKRLKGYLFHVLYTKHFFPYQPEEQSAYFSFGFSIFLGTLAALWHL